MRKRHAIIFALCGVVLAVLIVANLFIGSVDIPASEVMRILGGNGSSNEAWDYIILETRVPMIATALLAGAALSLAGLLLQTAFNNPLAGPSILGVSTGASLGVAVVMLWLGAAGGTLFGQTVGGYLGVLAGALVGALTVLGTLLLFSFVVESTTMLLIVGILTGYITSSLISLLNFFSTQEGVHSYVIWGLGSFNGVTLEQLPYISLVVIPAILWAALMVKPLNALLLGARYAANLGINVKSTRNKLLLISGILTASVTAFCGPIGFLGLVVPHIARLLLRTSNHNTLLPLTILCGCCTSLVCTLISVMPQENGVLPINAITPIIGVPIIIYIIVNRRKIEYFN